MAGIAHSRVDRIEIGPAVSVDWAAIEHALASGTELVMVDRRGRLTGRVSPPLTGPAELHLAQATAVMDETMRRELVRRLVRRGYATSAPSYSASTGDRRMRM